MELTQESITFGKYKGTNLENMLKDRSYCKWLLEQEWFVNDYSYLCNRVTLFNPLDIFICNDYSNTDCFINDYKFFRIKSPTLVSKCLDNTEYKCYEWYYYTVNQLKNQILDRFENECENPYDIKAPTKWLQVFELKYQIPRTNFKSFIEQYDLPNITSIVEDIKREGGIEYKGAKSFIIAKGKK